MNRVKPDATRCQPPGYSRNRSAGLGDRTALISRLWKFAGTFVLSGLLLFGASRTNAAIEADVALSYSPDAATRQGGDENIQVNLANSIVGGNVIHNNSQTGVRWRVAGYYKSTANPVDQDNNYVLSLVAGDAAYQDVRNFGASVGADLVSYYSHNTGSAGNAYQPGNYSVIGEQWIWYIVVAHELGHNYGCAHADGLGFTGTNGASYRTVMVHNYCGGTSIPYFTNPDLSYQGVQLLGTAAANCGTGSLISGGNNAGRIAGAAQGVADFRQRVLPPPQINGLRYRWSFNNAAGSAPAGTIILDSKSGAAAVVRGINATFTGNALRIPGGTTGNVAANSMSAYLDLPNGIISAQTNLTVEIWASPRSSQNWQRVCDFGRTVQAGNGVAGEWTGVAGSTAPGVTQASDNLFLSFSVGTDLNQQRFEAMLNGAAVGLNSGLISSATTNYYYALTFEDGVGTNGSAGGRIKWYRDGNQIAFKDVNFHLRNIEDVNNWLGRSQWSGDSNANADYDEVRIHNVALTANQVLAQYLAGPNVVVPSTPNVAGTLYVDLSPTNAISSTWTNLGTLGNFTKVGTPTLVANVGGTGVPGVFFNGSGQAYQGPNSVADIDGSSDRSIEVWVYNPSLVVEETMISWGHRNSTRGDMAFNFGNSTGWGAATHYNDDVSWITPPTAGAWHHLVYTYSTNYVRLYLDGTFQNGKLLGGLLATFANEPINLGCQRDSANGTRSFYFSGYLNSVRVHGGVLTPEQIAGNYLLGPALLPPNRPPVLAALSNQTVVAGVTITATNFATDPDWPAQALTFQLLAAPDGAVVDANSGVFSWRPTMAQGGSTNLISLAVFDNGTPVLGATQSLVLNIVAPAVPVLNGPALDNGGFGFSIAGDFGPDYSVLTSTNLSDWETLLTTNSPALPFWFQDSCATNFSQRFYRVRLGP